MINIYIYKQDLSSLFNSFILKFFVTHMWFMCHLPKYVLWKRLYSVAESGQDLTLSKDRVIVLISGIAGEINNFFHKMMSYRSVLHYLLWLSPFVILFLMHTSKIWYFTLVHFNTTMCLSFLVLTVHMRCLSIPMRSYQIMVRLPGCHQLSIRVPVKLKCGTFPSTSKTARSSSAPGLMTTQKSTSSCCLILPAEMTSSQVENGISSPCPDVKTKTPMTLHIWI